MPASPAGNARTRRSGVVHDRRVLLATALMAVGISALFVHGSWSRSLHTTVLAPATRLP